MKPVGPYVVEAHYPEQVRTNDGWLVVADDRLEYCRGYLARIREQSPRPAYRLLRLSDGRVMESADADDTARIGMVAGYPTGAQQLRAAARVLGRVREHADYVTAEEEGAAKEALSALGAWR